MKDTTKILKIFLALVFVSIFTMFAFYAVEAKADYKAKEGIVTSSRVWVRDTPDYNSKNYVTIHNGDKVKIIDEFGDWYVIDKASIGGEGKGYALKQFIHVGAYEIEVDTTVILWADPWGSGVANGEKYSGTKFLVLAETEDYYCVQTTDDSAGSSFIKKSDLYNPKFYVPGTNTTTSPNQGAQLLGPQDDSLQNTSSNNVGSAYKVITNTVAVRETPADNANVVAVLNYGDVVNVIVVAENYTSIIYNTTDGKQFVGWVLTPYLEKIQ